MLASHLPDSPDVMGMSPRSRFAPEAGTRTRRRRSPSSARWPYRRYRRPWRG